MSGVGRGWGLWVQAGGQEMEVDHGLRWLPPSMSVIRREQEQKKHRAAAADDDRDE